MSQSLPERLTAEQRYHPASPRRRNVLAVLHRATPPFSLDELVFDVAALEGATVSGPLSDAERRSLKISLHHNHLPKLDEAGVVDYDAREHVVTDWRRLVPIGGWEILD